jgi:hypothetical protein
MAYRSDDGRTPLFLGQMVNARSSEAGAGEGVLEDTASKFLNDGMIHAMRLCFGYKSGLRRIFTRMAGLATEG